MPSNIEIKARVREFAEIRRRAEALSNAPCQIISQEDTFFSVDKGRLKLRDFGTGSAQLIYYQRPNQDGPKRSDYRIFETDDPASLKALLESACGLRGVVRKTRYLYLVGQTRIHLDEVDGLGQFMELEVVLHDGQSDAEGQAIAEDLMSKLGIEKNDLLDGAYMDLLEKKSK
ncbi:MAG TPA: class IV adenylate cyclase [Anaerolineales bacterium]|nr:class IV adenylate cyclase [Anaerolineales bacterium]